MLAEMALKTEATTANCTFAIGWVFCSEDSFVVAESFMFRMNICSENHAHSKPIL